MVLELGAFVNFGLNYLKFISHCNFYFSEYRYSVKYFDLDCLLEEKDLYVFVDVLTLDGFMTGVYFRLRPQSGIVGRGQTFSKFDNFGFVRGGI